jgi:hypothetical protein
VPERQHSLTGLRDLLLTAQREAQEATNLLLGVTQRVSCAAMIFIAGQVEGVKEEFAGPDRDALTHVAQTIGSMEVRELHELGEKLGKLADTFANQDAIKDFPKCARCGSYHEPTLQHPPDPMEQIARSLGARRVTLGGRRRARRIDCFGAGRIYA